MGESHATSNDGAPDEGHDPDPALCAVPLALRRIPQWVCWRSQDREGRPTKIPIDAKTCGPASATDPSTWSSYERAVEAKRVRGHSGIGFVFTAEDRFTGVDLDDCIDDDGELVESAREIVEALDSYTEISPSGRGVKIFLAGRKPDSARCKSKSITGFKETEVYDRGRFFTITGRRFERASPGVEDRQAELEALCDRLWPRDTSRETKPSNPASECLDDDELLNRAFASKNGHRFRRIFDGDSSEFAGDSSAADQSVCNTLAFWTGRDAARIDALFRRSGLMRPKWDERRGDRTYGERTIEEAIASCRSAYGEPGPEGETGLGAIDPATGRIILSPSKTLPTARAYLDRFASHPEGRTLVSYAGELLEWRGNAYQTIEDEAIKKRLHSWLHDALQPVVTSKGEKTLRDFSANPTTVKHALETIRAETHLPVSTEQPAWLDADPARPPASEILACRSMSLHIPTETVLEPTPALFTTSALDYDYDPDPPEPERWVKFLEQLFGDDLESSDLLQEWFGYCLTPDTSQQKMLLLVGPRRSGKGTIGRVLRGLVGDANVAGPTIGGLAQPFGLQPLIGKSLAIVSDARFGGDKTPTVVERLLCVSGEDAITIDRKYLAPVTLRLGVRFVFLSNELPRLSDASSALAGRFLILRLTESFFGEEDPDLSRELFAERPGILKWALEGRRRLDERGRFVQPVSAADAVEDLEELGSPVATFIKERCDIGQSHRVDAAELYGAWREWSESNGASSISNAQTFGRDLRAALPSVTRRRGTGQRGFYDGIAFKGGHACQ